MADHDHRHAVQPGHAAHDRRIIGKTPLSVHLRKIRKHCFDIVKGIGTVRMAGYLGLLPGSKPGIDLGAQLVRFFMQFQDLFFKVDVPVRGEEGQFLDLFFQIGYRFFELKVLRRQMVLLGQLVMKPD